MRRWLAVLSALMGIFIAGGAGADYPPVVAGRELVFPADTGAHSDYRTEW